MRALTEGTERARTEYTTVKKGWKVTETEKK